MNLLLSHPPKSKSTLTVSNHNATSPVDKSIVTYSRSDISNNMSVASVHQSMPKRLLTGLLDPNFASTSLKIDDFKATPSIAISSVNSSSSSSSNSLSSAASDSFEAFILNLETNFKTISDNISIITNPNDAIKLFDYYYSSSNKLPSTSELFPYLHGLNGVKQRIFFDKSLNADYETNQKLANNVNPEEYNLLDFEGPIDVPRFQSHFPMMFVSSQNSNELDSCVDLLQNNVFIDELMTYDDNSNFKPFSYINDIILENSDPNIRNFDNQIKLSANFCNFLIYNVENDLESCLNAANIISKSLSIHSGQKIYILDIPDWQTYLGPFLESNSEFSKSPYIVPSNDKFQCKLLQWEQNLIWKENSNKWIHDSVCLGTLVDFTKLNETEFEKHGFKLFINCHQNASFPSLQELGELLTHLESPNDTEPVHLEFPSSGNISIYNITFEETLCFLNLLLAIHMIIKRNHHKIFLLCYDGFTGLSLLALAVSYILKLDEEGVENCSTEEIMLDLLSDARKDIKLYIFKSDFILLKSLEKYIFWMYSTKIEISENKQNGCLVNQRTQSLLLNLDHRDFAKFTKNFKKSQFAKEYDWFTMTQDNNFPSRIVDNFYLGSLNHASSVTILNAHKFTKIISLGEKPLWFQYLSKFLILECDLNGYRHSKKRVLKPIYCYNFLQIYCIKVNGDTDIKIPILPHLESIIYIHNLKDDGKDGILPLLTEIPEFVRNEFLIDLNTTKDTVLIHCRIGVSRSAVLVIATLMKNFKWSLLEAYMFVRVKRFNIIIQPNLKLFYELFLYEEYLRNSIGLKGYRNHCWESLCSEIHKLNDHYINFN